MTQQVPSGAGHVIGHEADDGTIELAPDLAYARLAIVNVVFAGRPGGAWVLVDAGVPGSASAITRLAAARFGSASRPSCIVMTHGHFDHVGALAHLAARWDVPVYAHPREHPYLDGTSAYPPADPTVGGGAIATASPLFPLAPVDLAGRLLELPADLAIPGMPGWQWRHTPGHAVGHVSFWREADRALIAGDAVVTVAQESAYAVLRQTPELHGPPAYLTHDWDKAARSARLLAALRPDILVSGHGQALGGHVTREALDILARDFERVAVPEHGRYVDAPRTAEDGTAYRTP